jgi:hypothetical protein
MVEDHKQDGRNLQKKESKQGNKQGGWDSERARPAVHATTCMKKTSTHTAEENLIL